MVRGFRRWRLPRAGNRFKPKGKLRFYKRKSTYNRSSVVRGKRFRAVMRSKGSKWQRFVIYDVLYNAHELTDVNAGAALTGTANSVQPPIPVAAPPGGMPPILAHNPDARTAYFGPAYAPGAGGPVDANNNPTGIGDGLLSEISARDAVMGFTRWDYSAAEIDSEYICDQWDARNNAGGPLIAIPATAIFVKGIKINLLGRSMAMPGLMYLGYQKNAGTPYKLREQVGKMRAYFSAKREARAVPAGARALHWSIPNIALGGPLYTRFKVTVYYKVKQLTVN